MRSMIRRFNGKNILDIVVLGDPVAQARPKFNSWTHQAYDPAKSKWYKKQIRNEAKKICESVPYFAPEIPLVVTACIYRPIPKSLKKQEKILAEQGEKLPVTRPDLDNYLKGILDALNKTVYKDDNQITAIHAYKFYSVNPRIEIEIKEG